MSRRTFQTPSQLKIVVGWDRMLGSFFAFLEKGTGADAAQEASLERFRGMGYGANIGQTLSNLEEIIEALEEARIQIPDEIQMSLLEDQSARSPASIHRGRF